jgi:hypothetical protein
MHRIFLLLPSTPNFQFCLLDLKMEQSGKFVILYVFLYSQVYYFLLIVEYGIQIPTGWRLLSIMGWSVSGPFVVCLGLITSLWVTMKDLS